MFSYFCASTAICVFLFMLINEIVYVYIYYNRNLLKFYF